MNAPITREKYEIRLGKVLDFIGIDVEDGNRSFVYTIASQGCRIRPIKKDGEIVAAKLVVYAGEDEEYFIFISREAGR